MTIEPISILLVDDDEDEYVLTRDRLAEAGGVRYELTWVDRYDDALAALRQTPPDVCLVDFRLGVHDGLTLIREALADEIPVPMILLTGQGGRAIDLAAMDAGAADYVDKSTVTAELLDRSIRYAIQHKASERKLQHLNAVLEAIRAVNQLMVRERNRDRLLHGAVRALTETRGYNYACIVLAESGDGTSEAAHVGVCNELPTPNEGFNTAHALCLRRALEQESVFVIPNPAEVCGDCALRAQHRRCEVMSVRLQHDEQLYGVLIVGYVPGFQQAARELELFRELADDISFGLYRIGLEEEQRRILADRERLLTTIRDQARRVQQVIDAVPEGVLLADAKRQVVVANPVARHLVGLEDSAAPAMRPPPAWEALLDDLLSPPVADGWREVRMGDRIIEVSARELGVGEAHSWVLVLRDVTVEREAQEEVQQQQRLAAVGQLAGGIAHDFNNLLTTIILYTHLSLDTPDLDPDVRLSLETIVSESQRAAELIQQILDFSRRAPMERRIVDLVALAQSAVEILRRTIPERIGVSLDLDANECLVLADATRLQQVLMNLAVNARDAMPEAGHLGIRVDRVPADQVPERSRDAVPMWARLTVSDDGTGIAPDVFPHLFEPFFTTKERGKGTGLGLAQVYGIVQQHGGAIDVETEFGVGTSFHVFLPLALPSGAVFPSNRPVRETLSAGTEHILLVEDQPKLRAITAQSLTALGYRVTAAADGHEALALFDRSSDVDLLLTDLVMPEMGGADLLDALRERVPGLKALAITGYALDEQVDQLRDKGFWDIVHKPFDASALARVVRACLDARSETTSTTI